MNRHNFPFIALALSVPLAIALVIGARPAAGDTAGTTTGLPLLTLLAISEFGLIVNLIAAGLGVHRLATLGWDPLRASITGGCVIFSLFFLSQLIRWWPL
jgi:hypothetical protein